MTKLYIDTSNSEKVIVKIDDHLYETDSKNKKAQALLPFIESALVKESVAINDIAEINVNTGPGSFTGLRVGVAVANTLGWALNIPVNGEFVSQKHFTQINYDSVD